MILYSGLSTESQVYLNYERIAKKEGVQNETAERGAWETFSGLAMPNREG